MQGNICHPKKILTILGGENSPGCPDQALQMAPGHPLTEQAARHHERGVPRHEEPGL